MRFIATERFSVDRVAFVWEARFTIARPLSIKVIDGYGDGRVDASGPRPRNLWIVIKPQLRPEGLEHQFERMRALEENDTPERSRAARGRAIARRSASSTKPAPTT
jgi:hypothetical protein